ncbi:MAG: hypothetical protein HY320_06425 [Armatimonadetes bacterium]|nr:hypothetical protein [Armatimonadota bacterium]
MRRATPAFLDLAGRLLAYEAGGGQQPQELAEATQRACQKLREHLSALIGSAGFRALLSRALTLAKTEFPTLAEVQIDAAGDLAGLHEAAQGEESAGMSGDMAAILAQFLWLLATFIGEDLALRLAGEVWPEVLAGVSGAGAEEAKA